MANVRISRIRQGKGPNLYRIWSCRPEASGNKLPKCLSAVAYGMFLDRIHLAEGLIPSFRKKDGVVPKAVRSPRRPDQGAAYAPFEARALAVGPGECQHAHEC